MKDTLRLLLFEECNRNCEGCCNKDFDLLSLPVEKDFSQYKTIILTGGEPMLKHRFVWHTIRKIRKQNSIAKIIMYTAKVDQPLFVLQVLKELDGITVTLHDQKDIIPLIRFNLIISNFYYKRSDRTFRLNIFKGIKIHIDHLKGWTVKKDIEWIKDCPLPTNEVFKRIERKK